MIRNHVTWSVGLADRLRALPDFKIVTEPMLSLFTFAYVPDGAADLDALNQDLVNKINDDGRIYITQTRIDGALVIRFQAGAFTCTKEDVDVAYDVIVEIARGIKT
jgi:aromatic-L-amino-acid decarboxylase